MTSAEPATDATTDAAIHEEHQSLASALEQVSLGQVATTPVNENAQDEQLQEEVEEQRVTMFCCQKCRCALFTDQQLSKQHVTGQHEFGYFKQAKDGKGSRECSSMFLSEPNQWMSTLAMADEVVGKLNCPKCGHRVGSFSWSGSQCSCGTWIVPAIQVPVSKVDPREIPVSMIPQHCADLKVPESPEFHDVASQQGEGVQGGEQSRDVKEEEEDPREIRAILHEQWIQHIQDGQIEQAFALVDTSDCSMTTVQKKIFDGKVKVAKVLGASSAKLQGRIKIVEPGAVVMPAPSHSTRIIFTVDGIKGRFGESIWWSSADDSEPKVQHIMRVKDPSDAYLEGQS
mmetsp:Transcript_4083/g.7156  ORF Transcript_4083/g.7156 Transcript_4083/m.7156 type:complete len:343 (+) Transcript_4083:52-1080(+)|eukprot:CAMPEP_0171518506 /NCGR_PEP_ID=MMETSP0959-20130129/5310_1 /TAXON_ID=87120 /ORGANISM="Aurantiochytrium limacinum, Strain ATCCMYA-1381" /LENGTH=342 /DNA_ID=CAMNT_0012057695 /DNA_START=26 /DNA_END=1054 /DNA_ORIENTATION=-